MAGIHIAKKYDRQEGVVLATGKTIDRTKYAIIRFKCGETVTFFDYGSDIHLLELKVGNKAKVQVETDYDAIITTPENIL